VSYLQLPEIQQVRPRLFIGTQHAASQKKLLKELEITHIISMNGSTPLWPGDFQYQTLFTTDDDDSMLLEHMLEAIHFMESALVNGGNVLVHCSRGVNRSGAMLIGYLMMSEGLSYSEALAVAREARPCISPRAGMMEQLLTWEQVLSMRKVCHASPLHKDDVLLKVIPTN
jgi:protein tyrosine phosphatase